VLQNRRPDRLFDAVLCRDIEHYNELSDYMSRGELGVEKFHGHVVLAVDKAFKAIRSIS